MFCAFSSSDALPVVDFADDSEYQAVNCSPLVIRRRTPKLMPL